MPDADTGAPRQRDVWAEAIIGMFPVKILISCKKLKRRINQSDMDAFVGELRSAGAHKGVLYAYSGFSKPALEKARKLGISCCKLYSDQPPELPNSLLLASYCYYDSFRLVLNQEALEQYGDTTFGEIFAMSGDKAEPPATVLDVLVRGFTERQSEEIENAAREGRLPGPWVVGIEIRPHSRELPPLRISLEGKWRVYKGRLEGHLLEGTYSFTEKQFRGSQISPMADLQGVNPGPLWELVSEPPAKAALGMSILFRRGGSVRESLTQLFAGKKLRELV